MIQLIVKNLNNQKIAEAKFETLELAEAYLASQTESQAVCLWGKLAHSEHVCAEGHNEHAECATIEHPQEFTVEYIDIGDADLLSELEEKAFFALRETDWTLLADADLTSEEKKMFADYRAAIKNEFKKANVKEIKLPEKIKLQKFKRS